MKTPCGYYTTNYESQATILHTRLQVWLAVAAILGLCALPYLVPPYWITWSILTGINLIVVLGLVVLTAYCGQISLGQAAFMGLGAYAYGNLVLKLQLPAPAALVGAGLITAAVGIVFGLAAVRTKGYYLAMVTLAAQIILTYVFLQARAFTGGFIGLTVPRMSFGGEVLSTKAFYYIVLACAFILGLIVKNIRRTKWGRSFTAIRDNDLAAKAMGVNVATGKILAFAISCFYAGVAGGLLAGFLGLVSPDNFTLLHSIFFLLMLAIGGIESLSGGIFGCLFVSLVQEGIARLGMAIAATGAGVLTLVLSLGVFGGIVVLLFTLEPRGLAHLWDRIKNFYRLWPFSY